jgi:hypothetical protein
MALAQAKATINMDITTLKEKKSEKIKVQWHFFPCLNIHY